MEEPTITETNSGKIKVTFYMKSGNVFSLKFREFSITRLSGSRGERNMEYEGCETTFTVDVDQIEAVVVEDVVVENLEE